MCKQFIILTQKAQKGLNSMKAFHEDSMYYLDFSKKEPFITWIFFFPKEYFSLSSFLQVPQRQMLFVSNEEIWSEFQNKKRSMN